MEATREIFSENVISEIRNKIIAEYSSISDFTIIVNGSYARKEASKESDLDWIAVFKDEYEQEKKDKIIYEITSIINELVSKDVGSTGTFGEAITLSEIQNNFGGDKDSNQSFTRRMLLLLESDWLFNKEMFDCLRENILEKYIKEDSPDSSINRFMLNDIIRYYRTMCTDYEYKTTEQSKSWGLRKIKLRFSRKIIYFSGVVTVAATSNLTRDEKIKNTIKLLEMPPLERIFETTGNKKISIIYKQFLDEISKPSVREQLEEVSRENRSSNPTYRKLKNLSDIFSQELEKTLATSFSQSHPIHVAMLF